MTKLGFGLTGGVCIAIVVLLVFRWNDVSDLKLNEWGDWLAGVSATLAFIWLIIGHFQQQVELRQNTEMLELQANELRNSVEETKNLARSASQQVEIANRRFEYLREQSAPQFVFTGMEGEPVRDRLKLSFINKGGKILSLFASTSRPEVEASLSKGPFIATEESFTVYLDGRAPELCAGLTFQLKYEASGISGKKHFRIEGWKKSVVEYDLT